jgi:hypothetical protein
MPPGGEARRHRLANHTFRKGCSRALESLSRARTAWQEERRWYQLNTAAGEFSIEARSGSVETRAAGTRARAGRDPIRPYGHLFRKADRTVDHVERDLVQGLVGRGGTDAEPFESFAEVAVALRAHDSYGLQDMIAHGRVVGGVEIRHSLLALPRLRASESVKQFGDMRSDHCCHSISPAIAG